MAHGYLQQPRLSVSSRPPPWQGWLYLKRLEALTACGPSTLRWAAKNQSGKPGERGAAEQRNPQQLHGKNVARVPAAQAAAAAAHRPHMSSAVISCHLYTQGM